MKKFLIILFAAIVAIVLFFILTKTTNKNQQTDSAIRYVALGDSYTIGEGVGAEESWPMLLVGRLREESIAVRLVANPSVTGFTTQDVIDRELSVYESSDPQFATLLIGVNDWVKGVDRETFRKNLVIILDRMQKKLPDKQKLILVTIPDFSKTPTGKIYDRNGQAEKGIADFNKIIKEEGNNRGLSVVDIYQISQKAKDDSAMTASDGLHPSAKQYKLWTDLIYPRALTMLQS